MSWSYSNAPKDGVEVQSWHKLNGFAQYLYREEHKGTGENEYRYMIPDDLKAKAIELGGTIIPTEGGERETETC